jgi:CheY-like chemotaxis protein
VSREVLNVLVVEDDPIYGHFILSTLSDAGHQVALARDGASALEQARASAPDAVILDLRLPDATGYDIASALRRDVLAPAAVIIVLTASMFPSLDDAEAVGVDLVLSKPTDAQLVIGLVDHVRERRQLRLQRAKR